MNKKSIKGSLLLLLGSVIWGAAFAAQSNWFAAMGETLADTPQADWVKEASEDVLDSAYGPDMLGGRSSGKCSPGWPAP